MTIDTFPEECEECNYKVIREELIDVGFIHTAKAVGFRLDTAVNALPVIMGRNAEK